MAMLRIATSDDISALYQLEIESFPPNEAASEETMRNRCANANDYFYCQYYEENLIGFVNGTCTSHNSIEHESMTTHDSLGDNLVIHSVTVAPNHRRHGTGSAMLCQYLESIRQHTKIRNVMLLSKAYLLKFYCSCGFEIRGVSDVVHGQDTWFELALDLRSTDQYQVDAFSDGPFTGNPAAVVFEHRSDWWMQKVAEENNLAETAFVSLRKSESSIDGAFYDLRWFTPNKEVELCGHATLGAAHALYETKRVPAQQPIVFHTVHSGQLRAQGLPDGSIELDFPTNPPVAFEPTAAEWSYITEGLGITQQDVKFVGRSLYDVLVEVTPRVFAGLNPKSYSAIEQLGGRGLIVTCVGGLHSNTESQSQSERSVDDTAPRHKIVCDERFDFLSRFFAPRYAINEDPVTGSAHCTLAPYWLQELPLRYSDAVRKEHLSGFQASSRGGIVAVSLSGADRVMLRGYVTTTIKSKLIV